MTDSPTKKGKVYKDTRKPNKLTKAEHKILHDLYYNQGYTMGTKGLCNILKEKYGKDGK